MVLTAPTTVCSLSIVGGDQEQQQRQRHCASSAGTTATSTPVVACSLLIMPFRAVNWPRSSAPPASLTQLSAEVKGRVCCAVANGACSRIVLCPCPAHSKCFGHPLQDSCGSMLTNANMGGMDGMGVFYDRCLETLYPPGWRPREDDIRFEAKHDRQPSHRTPVYQIYRVPIQYVRRTPDCSSVRRNHAVDPIWPAAHERVSRRGSVVSGRHQGRDRAAAVEIIKMLPVAGEGESDEPPAATPDVAAAEGLHRGGGVAAAIEKICEQHPCAAAVCRTIVDFQTRHSIAMTPGARRRGAVPRRALPITVLLVDDHSGQW